MKVHIRFHSGYIGDQEHDGVLTTKIENDTYNIYFGSDHIKRYPMRHIFEITETANN